MGKNLLIFVGGVAAGATIAALVIRHGDKAKPLSAKVLAKAMKLKEKALNCAVRTREQVEDIVAEARQINASGKSGA
ncbi:MAG: hypothetical protein LBU64_11195 [Planctomycetota bacterium]|jgi:hypothetical protein|nr:hypothetical protein [Planctomycetota bacterium]